MIISISLRNNPDKLKIHEDYQYVDSRGMGIRTKVIPTMREFNGTEPEFEASEDFLKTTLYNNGPKSDLNEPNLDPNLSLEEQILSILQRNPRATYSVIWRSIAGKAWQALNALWVR